MAAMLRRFVPTFRKRLRAVRQGLPVCRRGILPQIDFARPVRHELLRLRLVVAVRHIDKTRPLTVEVQLNRARGAVSVFGDDDFRDIFTGIFNFLLVVTFPIEKRDDIRVLLQ